jgi:1,2-diacylglycerol 3-alpha-glucosyltransferase
MHLVVLFHNVGGYHAARLRAVQRLCEEIGWALTAVQVTDSAREHQWGNLESEVTFDLRTLLPSGAKPMDVDSGQGAHAAARAMRRFLTTIRPNVVAIPGWGYPVSRSAQAWAKRHGALAILMSETKRDDAPRHWWKDQFKSRLYVRRFDAALVGGQSHFDYLVDLGFPKERIFVGYDVVDNDYFQERASAAQSDPDAARRRDPRIPVRPFFLCATRLIERKNVSCLVEAYAAYRQQIGPGAAWDLAICGSGEEEERIRSIANNLNLEKCVHLPGFVSYQQIGDWYGLANAFIHPALDEPWGLVINEACAAGLPILGSRTVGACYELVKENENGFLFDPRSTEAIAGVMVKAHQLDEEARKGLGAASRRIVAAFSPKLFAANLFKAIDSAQAFRNGDLVRAGNSEVVSQAR